jgi:hypothetical protein
LSGYQHTAIREKIAEKVSEDVGKHNEQVEANLAKLSLSSSRKSDLLGGISNAEVGLAGVLKRYFVERFVEDVARHCPSNGEALVARSHGMDSLHRSMRQSGDHIVSKRNERNTRFETYLRTEDHGTAMGLLKSSCMAIGNKTRSMKGMLDHLENLHHSSVPFVEGLTVELLEFQRQSVQWALERETTPGGVQSFLWAKLPSVAEPGQDIYFSPVLERFRRDKPQLVRGGIIAEGRSIIFCHDTICPPCYLLT